MKAATSPELISYMVNRPAQGMFPDSKLASQVVIIHENYLLWSSPIWPIQSRKVVFLILWMFHSSSYNQFKIEIYLGILSKFLITLQLKNTLLRCAPSGMNGVTTMMCGSCSNEHAFKAVFKAKFSIRLEKFLFENLRNENLKLKWSIYE